MQIKVDSTYAQQLRELVVSHAHESSSWNVEMYSRTTLQNANTLFDNLNGYFASLTLEKQETLWKCYQSILESMESISEPTRLHAYIQENVKTIYEILSFEELKRWTLLHGVVNMPVDLKLAHLPTDSELTQRLTYLRDDYYDLAIFSALLKALLPIFGECFRRVGKEVRSKFKEHYAFSLLSKSAVLKLPAFYRLRDYVEAKTQNEERKNPAGYRKNSAIFGGLGTAELPDWLLAKALVRRVAVHEETIGDNVVANVYHTIDQQISSLDKTFNGRVNEKKLYSGQTDEDNVSIVENYKVKQEISDGDLCVLSVYTDHPETVANHVDPSCNLYYLELCVSAAIKQTQLVIGEHHLTLAQWVLASAIPPRGIPALNKPTLLKALGVTQALLWHWGFKELALLMLANPTPTEHFSVSVPTSRLSKRAIDTFTELYPHYQLPSSASTGIRVTNVACRAIDLLASSLIQSDWIPGGPSELLVELKLSFGEVWVVSAEIRQELAELVFKLNEL
jgi:hypothetical protein